MSVRLPVEVTDQDLKDIAEALLALDLANNNCGGQYQVDVQGSTSQGACSSDNAAGP